MSVTGSRPAISAATAMMTCVVVLMLTTMARHSLACFPMQDVFRQSTRWMQMTSMDSRRRVQVGEEAADIMIVETAGTTRHTERLRCLIGYGENRYLVKIEDEQDENRYLCYQFTALTDYVIRQGRTEESISRKKVNCIEDYYTEDEEVLLAYKAIQPQQCPLAGGYQLIMHQGMAVGGHCMNTVKTYNPHIQFHCDGRGSGNVLVDFGKACQPTTLTPYMGQRHLTHLKCVSHWQENGFHAVLLQMRDYPENFWCLHYKIVTSNSFSGKNAAHEELLKVFLTVDGRCSSQAFGTEDVPRNTSMFGHLASYKPFNDIKCTEKVYVESCKLNEDKCLESVECPSYCGRCKKQMTNQSCSFPAEALGFWKVLNPDRRLEVTVEKSRIKSPNFGDFLCLRSPATGGQDYIYSVVQASTAPTCMPYYSCAKLLSPSPGVLTFQLRPGFRSLDSGELLACEESHQEGVAFFQPPDPEKTVTLINENKLHSTSCKLAHKSTFPTKFDDECKFVVHECSGSCQTFNVSFDVASCGNNTQQIYNIENQHTCYATIQFADTVRGILAKTGTTGRYLCWIFGSSRLFVATVEDCNQDSVNRIFRESTADVLYDPVTAISLASVTDNSARTNAVQIPSVFMYSLLLAYILGLVFTTNDCR